MSSSSTSVSSLTVYVMPVTALSGITEEQDVERTVDDLVEGNSSKRARNEGGNDHAYSWISGISRTRSGQKMSEEIWMTG